MLSASDASAIVICGGDPGCAQGPPVLDLWDTNHDGALSATDASNAVIRGGAGTEYLNTCARRPEGTPPN